MDPKQVPPQVGVNSGSVGSSATGSPIFASPANNFRGAGANNRFQDTNPKGDIIIPPSDGSKSSGDKKPLNKKLIIGIIAGVVVVIAAVVLVVVLAGNGGNKAKKSTSVISDDDVAADVSASVAEKFNMYANFIISGEASPNRIPREDDLEERVIVQKVIDHDTDFMNEAKGYFDDFYESLSSKDSDDEEGDGELINTADAYKQIFDFLYQYTETEIFSVEDIKEMVEKEGVPETEKTIDSNYKDILDMTGNPTAVTYAETRIAYDKAIANGSPDTSTFFKKTSGIMLSTYDRIVSNCYDIEYILYGNDETNSSDATTVEEEDEE